MASAPYSTEPGNPHPIGAVPDENGVNFSVFSQNGTAIELLLFDKHDDPAPVQVIELDPQIHNTFHFWHVYVRGLEPDMHYAYRVDGPYAPEDGHRFNRNKVLIDPYARGNSLDQWVRGNAVGPEENLETSIRSAVIDLDDYDWEGDEPLQRPMSESVIYEMHVGGFTRSDSADVDHPGTFRGVIEKIPYLKELGVTAVELLPVQQFDDHEVLREGPEGQKLTNYWGYSTMGFFSPHDEYCVESGGGSHIREFRDMVKALHDAGIEVILDIVFNHTDEGNRDGPTFSFKGFDNSIYYHLVPDSLQYYMDYSGCGNTVDCNHPVPEKFILECLEFWVEEMHVDGFRFDEASILSRDLNGEPLEYPPVPWHIELSEALSDTKVFAEAWDASGLYQIGYFPGYRWAEWNGVYRDDIRQFVRGDGGLLGDVASRISGSADLYQSSGKKPINSVNFITAHDGFTLNDLVSYNEKHNWANGEQNRDGADDNMGWNCGEEGATDDPEIQALRQRQVKNFASILMLSQGVPMITMGDEVRRTQDGNNNAYCQDNEISWFDWENVDEHDGVLRFFKKMIAFRREHPILHRQRFFNGDVNDRDLLDIAWHGTELHEPGWDDPNGRTLAFTLGGFGDDPDMHVIMNMYWEPLDCALPDVPGRSWHRVVDTAQPSPKDFLEQGTEIDETTYTADGRSVVVLTSK